MNPDVWLIYLLAAIGLSLTPGPNGLLALTNGAIHGVRKTLFTVAGGALGFLLVIAVSMFGIGALLAASVEILTVLKWVGGAYLVWLGIQVWRSPAIGVTGEAEPRVVRGGVLFGQGLLAAVTNPKGILFFVAFLPQFIDPAGSLVLQFVIMAGTFVLVEIITEVAIAGFSKGIQPALARFGRQFNRTCGLLFIVIGVVLPFR